jgi:hypothetical protein
MSETETVVVNLDDLRALLAALTHTYLRPSLTPAYERLVKVAER